MNAGTATVFYGSTRGLLAASAQVLEGVAGADYFGISVASAGDVNGDGYADLVVGAYNADPSGRMDAGTVSVFHGSASGVLAAPTRVLEGAAAGDYFGISVASAGDVNGDGYADLVVGAPYADPSGRMEAGTASVFHGSASGVLAAPAQVLESVYERGQFGYSVASAGDVNGDGYADIVVGANIAAPSGRRNAGAASVFHGSASGVLAAPTRVLEGAAAGDGFGVSVASAGDVNGDGYADLVVGAYGASPSGRMQAGTASVFHGSASGVLAAPTRVLEGAAAGDGFGVSVASAGDVNGDGYADLVVGAWYADPSGRMNAGTASVFHGSASGVLAAPARVLEGAAAGDRFGNSVASAGDVNGDGGAYSIA
jgi:ribosomal protein L35AE/L33A